MPAPTSSALTSSETRALQHVDAAELAGTLTELLAVPSVSGSDAECEVQHLLAGRLDRLGLAVDLWPLDLPALSAADGFPGTEAARSQGWGLVGTLAGEGPSPALALQGHVDVVPPGDRGKWAADPFTPTWVGNRVHARGACDMKAGLAANLMACAAITRAGIALPGGLALQFVIGEEDGGLGAFGTLARGHRADACLISEPTGGTLVTEAAGALTFTLEVPGVATHASTPDAGVSALDAYLPLHRALADLQTERNRVVEPLLREYPVPYAIVVGRLRAGDWSSSVPDRLTAEGRLGVRVGEAPEDARRQLEERIAETADRDPFLREHPPVVSWSGGQFAGGRLTPGSPLREVVTAAHADVSGGGALRERGTPYGSDLRLYAAEGIPTLHYGPGEVRLAHGPHESVDLEEVLTVTRALVLTVLRTCGAR